MYVCHHCHQELKTVLTSYATSSTLYPSFCARKVTSNNSGPAPAMRQARTRMKNERKRAGMSVEWQACVARDQGFKPLLTSQFADWYQVLHPVSAPCSKDLGQKKRAFVHRFLLRKCCARRNACEDALVIAHVQSAVAGSGPQHQGLEVAQPVIRLAVGRDVIILAPARAWWAGSTVQWVGLVGKRG